MTGENQPRWLREAAGVCAIILSVGMVFALNMITAALLWAASQRLGIDPDSGISDNGVQILLAWGSSIVAVIAGYVGYVTGRRSTTNVPDVEPFEEPDESPELPYRPPL